MGRPWNPQAAAYNDRPLKGLLAFERERLERERPSLNEGDHVSLTMEWGEEIVGTVDAVDVASRDRLHVKSWPALLLTTDDGEELAIDPREIASVDHA